MITDVIRLLAAKTDSFYLYDESVIRRQTALLKENFPGVSFLYSIKCNPNQNILKTVFSCGFGADAASAEEVCLAARAGLSPDQIFYSAPGKNAEDLQKSLCRCTVIADSLSEIERISRIAGSGCIRVGLRINPDFTFENEKGAASKFGVDEEEALAFLRNSALPNVRITGIHVHVKSQELNAKKLVFYYTHILQLAQRAEKALGKPLEFLNMGSGIGIPYSAEDPELNLEHLGRETSLLLANYRAFHPDTRILIETGRYAVCSAGLYVTHVADRKVSHGKTFLLLRNTLNGFIRPSLALLVKKYSGEAFPSPAEPLFTETNAFSFEAPYPERDTETVTLAGNLCTAADVIAENIRLPRLNAGDLVIISNAGAYARVLSPMQFSSLPVPPEYLLLENGMIAE